MRETIEALTELQLVDDEIRGFKVQRDELASNLDRLKRILVQMGEDLRDKREKLAEAAKFYSDKQTDLQADADRMAKAKQKMAGVTRTKEYAAMQRELDNLRRKYSEDELELKRLSEAIEEYKASIAVQEDKLQELEGEVAREQAASADRLGQLDASMSAVATKKSEITVRLPARLVRRYDRILGKRDGKAVVPATAGVCTGCQMKLPAQQFILVQRYETLQECPNCQRYLYFQDVEPEE